MCFMKPDDDSSKDLIKMQKEEAKLARQKETDRQARINAGLVSIKNMFEGRPVMKDVANKFDWSKFAAPTLSGTAAERRAAATGPVSGLPAGYTYVQVPGTAAVTPAATGRSGNLRSRIDARQVGQGNSGQQSGGPTLRGGNEGHHPASSGHRQVPLAQAAAAPATTWAIKGPDGKIYTQGQDLGFTTQADTGKREGSWQDKFYNDFKQGILDYYNPQVQEQYGKSKEETTYRHARAGTLRSSSAIDSAADLAKQNAIRTGEVRSKADISAAELKNRVAAERAKAVSQLYATENPEVAANQALAAITNISAEKPDMTPLGQVFELAGIGGANLLSSVQNARLRNQYVPGRGGYGATRTV